jgi:hypothetical protein
LGPYFCQSDAKRKNDKGRRDDDEVEAEEIMMVSPQARAIGVILATESNCINLTDNNDNDDIFAGWYLSKMIIRSRLVAPDKGKYETKRDDGHRGAKKSWASVTAILGFGALTMRVYQFMDRTKDPLDM